MMFRFLGVLTSRFGTLVLLFWGLAWVVCTWTAPRWNDVVHDGEFAFLPDAAPSRVAETFYREAFSRDPLGSTAVIVVRRLGRTEGLLPQDREFIEHVLRPRIRRIAEEQQARQAAASDHSAARPVIQAVRTVSDRAVGRLLDSDDGKATLVVVELTTGSLDRANWPTIRQIETLIAQDGELVGEPGNLFAEQLIPPGLDLALSGPATVGRDLRMKTEETAAAVSHWTRLIVIVLLVLICRAPLLALIPCVTVFLAVSLARAGLAHLAWWGWIELFAGVEIYLTVVLTGAGVGACLLLMARQNEEHPRCPTLEEATTLALRWAGPAMVLGAGTGIVSIGLLVFAEFGKFRQLGAALALGWIGVLLVTLTLTPALLVLFGRWAFWPYLRTERISAYRTWSRPRGFWSGMTDPGWPRGLGEKIGLLLRASPGRTSLGCLLVLASLACVAMSWHGQLTYGLLSELPPDEPSVKGAEIVEQHFSTGMTGPLTLLIRHPDWDFASTDGKELIAELSDSLERQKEKFGIADIRSVAFPLGLDEKDVGSKTFLQRSLRHRLAVEYYVSDKPPWIHRVTKLDLFFDQDPFSQRSIEDFEQLKRTLPDLLPKPIAGADCYFLGAPASIRDLKTVTDRDRLRIYALVLAGTFCGFLLLPGPWAWAGLLVAASLLGYLATLGLTFLACWAWSPDPFAGLDWRVPPLLFALLMSLGANAHVLFMARIHEEQQRHGLTAGILVGIERFGIANFGWGLIMAGVFASLWAGSLVGLKQLGLALALGTLLEAFLIRPLLIPACMVLVQNGFFGSWGRPRESNAPDNAQETPPTEQFPAILHQKPEA